jgi:hypothetical protein
VREEGARKIKKIKSPGKQAEKAPKNGFSTVVKESAEVVVAPVHPPTTIRSGYRNEQ